VLADREREIAARRGRRGDLDARAIRALFTSGIYKLKICTEVFCPLGQSTFSVTAAFNRKKRNCGYVRFKFLNILCYLRLSQEQCSGGAAVSSK